ncbi:hypothetical protein ACP70R_029571 [Stipagrostis hirtigluma subsp. patula]
MRGEANGGDRREDDEEERPRGEEQEDDEEQRRRGEGAQASLTARRGQQGQGQRAGRPSSGPQPQPATRNVGYVGKHRLSAAISRLDQELQSLQDELKELETMEPASAACQEVITSTEGKPDPLLPYQRSRELFLGQMVPAGPQLSQQQMVGIQGL